MYLKNDQKSHHHEIYDYLFKVKKTIYIFRYKER